MISWLQKVLQKHYKWLFSVILAIVIVSFVFTIGASPGIGRASARSQKNYYGYNLNSPQDVQKLLIEANISNLFSTGQYIAHPQVAQQLAFSRPPLLYLANSLEIPAPNEFQLEDYIKSRTLFKNPLGNFEYSKYNEFLASLKDNERMNEVLVRQVLSEDYRIEQARKILSGPGYVLPYEVQFRTQQQNTLWSIDVATLKISSLINNVQVNDDALVNYFEKYKLNYAIPPRTVVSYVLFPENKFEYLTKKPTNEELKDFFERNVSLFPDADSNKKPFEEIKEKLIPIYKKNQAQKLAMDAANDFVYKIYEQNVSLNSEKFKRMLEEYGLVLIDIQPFHKNSMPKNTPIAAKDLETAFTLSNHHFFSDAIQTEKGPAILFYKETLSIEYPSFEKIKDKLKERYIADQTLILLKEKTEQLEKEFKEKAKLDSSFATLAHANGLDLSEFNNFKIVEAPKGFDKSLLTDLITLNQHEISKGIMRDDASYFLYVRKKEIPAFEKENEASQKLYKQLQEFASMTSLQGSLEELITAELKKTEEKEVD